MLLKEEQDAREEAQKHIQYLQEIISKFPRLHAAFADAPLLPQGLRFERAERLIVLINDTTEATSNPLWHWRVHYLLKFKPSGTEDYVPVEGGRCHIDLAPSGMILGAGSGILPFQPGPSISKRFTVLHEVPVVEDAATLAAPILAKGQNVNKPPDSLQLDTNGNEVKDLRQVDGVYAYNAESGCYAFNYLGLEGKVPGCGEALVKEKDSTRVVNLAPESRREAIQWILPTTEYFTDFEVYKTSKAYKNFQILNYLSSASKFAQGIFNENGISWLKFEVLKSNDEYLAFKDKRPFDQFPLDGRVLVSPYVEGTNGGYTSSFIKSEIGIFDQPMRDSMFSPERFGYFIAHEVLHQYLLRLGYILTGNFRYFSPDFDGHLNYGLDGEKILNLNLQGDLYNGGITGFNPNNTAMRRMHPFHLRHLSSAFTYYEVSNANLRSYFSINKYITIQNNNSAFSYKEMWLEEFKYRIYYTGLGLNLSTLAGLDPQVILSDNRWNKVDEGVDFLIEPPVNLDRPYKHAQMQKWYDLFK